MLARHAAQALAALRAQSPLVQAITNQVVSNFTANALLALGASPAMVDVPQEAGPFAAMASCLLVNLGTPAHEQRAAAVEAAQAARHHGKPWVLDPVAVGALPVRTQLAAQLFAMGPSIVRGNASEILALHALVAGERSVPAGGRGVDATASVDDARAAALALARRAGVVVAVSGPVDCITDGHWCVQVHTGTPLLTRVTGGGCALGAVMAAFAASAPDGSSLSAAAAATACYTLAAEHAAARAAGPGSFAVALLDALAALSPAQVQRDARLTMASA